MIQGSCLCGEVGYEISGAIRSFTHCHCSMCRKAHGAALASYAEVSAADLRFTKGGEWISRYRSSENAQRSFCRRCGSNLLFESDASPDRVWVPAGGFDSDPKLRPNSHIFVGSKASWFEINDDLPQFEADPE